MYLSGLPMYLSGWQATTNPHLCRDPQFCQENKLVPNKHPLWQHKRRFYTRTSSYGQYWNYIYYILFSWRWRSSSQSAKKKKKKSWSWLWLRSWGLYCKIQAFFSLKKVGKTTRPFRCDLNQIPYDYTVEAAIRFKGLDLIECLMNYGWRFKTSYRKQWPKSSPNKRNARRQNDCLRRPYK